MIFGDALISIEELCEELRRRIPELAVDDSNRAYTMAVKEALAEVAEALDLRMFCTDSDRKTKEFLLDFVLWSDKPGEQKSVLAVESEWGKPGDKNVKNRADQVVEDFEKLLVFKAPLKLMLFQADDEGMRRAIHNGLREYLTTFAQHVKGEQYLFMEFSHGHCYSYTWAASNDGLCPNAHLRAMDAKSENARTFRKRAAAATRDATPVVPASR
ncbi:MAG: hypothetical protein DMG65_08610 [Candidatus Angelobacter sp. Gp1-AA117]|nr:MAG: hypothetical protein DMG65_08610 [Candidatus Angelobacter sp. Gp1-AA117]